MEAVTQKSTKHPKGLYSLFFTEMWERFSFYGMSALLVLYLTSVAMEGGFGLERASALEIYAIFTGLVYLTPIIGGLLADKYLGQRKAVYIGGLLMALGNFTLAYSAVLVGADTVAIGREDILNIGLGLLIAGNGFFKPNISTMVGGLYEQNDVRRDSGFTIFYMGINLGAFLAPLVAGTLGEVYGWQYGFSASGIGMLLGLMIFFFTRKDLGKVGLPPSASADATDFVAKDWLHILLIVVGTGFGVWGMLTFFTTIADNTYSIIKNSIFAIGALYVLYIIFTNTTGKDQWSRVGVIFILAIFNVFFWAGFGQLGGTLNLFAEENTNRAIGAMTIPTTWFQSINPLAIFALAPVFALLWIFLSKVGKNPNIPVKFGLGMILLGAAFVLMYFGSQKALGETLVSPLWLVGVYMLITVGELFLSPVGLSMVTKLSPPKIVSLMMGLWFISLALGFYIAGILENLLHKFDINLFLFLVITSIAAGVVLLLISPVLKKMMRGVS